MQKNLLLIIITFSFLSCEKKSTGNDSKLNIKGTWKLFEATIIEKGDTAITDYTKDISFIKIINDSHFAFLSHNIPSAKDSSSTYSSGGGKYSLTNDVYTEHLEYCSDKAWEGHDFQFKLEIHGDTLVQTGVEKVENAGVDRLNIEKYVLQK
jgi:Lipocalin-like domain